MRAVAAGDVALSPAVTRQLLDRVAHRLPASTPASSAAAEQASEERPIAAGPASDR